MEAIILVTILNVIYREFLRAILYGSKAAGAPTFGPAGRDVGEETWFPSNFVDPAKWFRRTPIKTCQSQAAGANRAAVGIDRQLARGTEPALRAFLDSANAYSGHWSAGILAARWPERGGRDLEHQGECVDRRRDRLAEPKKNPSSFPDASQSAFAGKQSGSSFDLSV
jgi:hypothetical protein